MSVSSLEDAYTACVEITRREARNFYYGIRLLPPAKRTALCAVYALARRIDDIGDDAGPAEQKLAALGAVREALHRPADGSDPVMIAVTDAVTRYPIPMGAFEELVDGVEADVRMDADPDTAAGFYATFDDMAGYCRCVAGSVGRLCLGIFGSRPHPDAPRYADALGIALQQTNILRDIREDLLNGRVYLPREELERFGAELVLDEHGVLVDKSGGLAELIRFSAERAREWYADGLRLIPLLDRRSAACATAMAGIYRKLLDDIAADPASVYHQRRSLSGGQKAVVAVRALTGFSPVREGQGAMTDVGVVGGGLAGITAALRCADAGRSVVLVEARPRLGGLASSFSRSYDTGELDVDNGQHVFLRCCTSYRALLERLGVAHLVTLQDRLDIPVAAPGRPAGRLRRTRLPAPLHLAGALLRYRHLPVADRLRLVPAALALRSVDAADPATDAQRFGDWLAIHRQSPRAVDALWDLVGIATLNARAADASLALAATVFQLGLLTDAAAGDIGWAAVPLGRLHDTAARERLREAGVDVRTGTKVRALTPAGGGWRIDTGRESGSEESFMVDRIVSAVPPAAAHRLLPPEAMDRPPGWADALGSTPIVNVHVVYDRRVLDSPFAAGVGSPVQWVFDRTRQSGAHRVFPADAQYVAISLSAADDLIGTPVADLRERMLPALRDLLPAARDAAVLDFFVTREPHATFRAAPGTAALRARPTTTLPGLFVAGAWTATGWPATMEGAVRSGDAAAGALLAHTGRPAEAAA